MNALILKFSPLRQIIRYGLVGTLSNMFGYLIYLLITFFWLEPKVAITFFYPLSAIIAYFGHFKYSFSYKGQHISSMLRYVCAYFIGYIINLMMLSILSDKFKLPHQAVQALAIPLVAVFLFLMLKYFVFSTYKIKGTE